MWLDDIGDTLNALLYGFEGAALPQGSEMTLCPRLDRLLLESRLHMTMAS